MGFILTGALAALSSILGSYLSWLADCDDPVWRTNPESRTRQLKRLRTFCPKHAENLLAFLNPVLVAFVFDLSDQQLITGLLVIILSYPKYFYSNTYVGLWNLDLVRFFSIIAHFAIILTIRRMLRHNFQLAVTRMILAFVTFVLWYVTNLKNVIGVGFELLRLLILAG